MFEDSLFTPMEEEREKTSITGSQFFINFLNQLEGWKTKCKNLHWAAPKKNIHVYLDEFLEVLSEYQDSIAEDYQGILGHMNPNVIKGIPSDSLTAIEMIMEIKKGTCDFYTAIPEDTCYVGIKSETENFIHNLNKYKYLFELTDAKNRIF